MKERDRFGGVVRFTDFEADLRTGELRKRGLRVRLPEQPFQILTMLLEEPGELVTREELQKKLWPVDTFVELDLSLNAAIKKLRKALGDDALSPRYIETLPRRGYRFIAPVDGITAGAAPLIRAELDAEMGSPGLFTRRASSPCEAVPAQQGHQQKILQPSAGGAREPSLRTRWGLRTAALLAMLVVGLAVGWLVWNRSPPLPELKQKSLTSNSSEIPVLSGAISPDGKYAAYSDSGSLHLKLLDTGEVRTLPRPSWFPSDSVWNVASWFPDGTQLLTNLFQPSGRSSIWAVSVMGENPHELRDDAMAQTVSPDGSRIAFITGAPNYDREIWTMSAQGRDPQKVLAAGEE